MPAKGYRDRFVQVAALPTAAGAPERKLPLQQVVTETKDPNEKVLRLLESVSRGLSKLQVPKQTYVKPSSATPAVSHEDETDSVKHAPVLSLIDPRELHALLHGDGSGDLTVGRRQILDRCSKLLPKLLNYNAKKFNFYSPGMRDHFDHPPSVIREHLRTVMAAMMFGATPQELRRLKPSFDVIHEKILNIDQNVGPPRSAAKPGKALSYALGTRNPEHYLSIPNDLPNDW